MLEIKDLRKNFGTKKVLKGIDLTVNKGDIIGIIGPSGCGKSTFLRCINLLEIPTKGTMILEGNKVNFKGNLTYVRKKIGMVFQQFNLFNNMTLLDKKNYYPKELSGGQMQRIAIIRSLLMKPDIILFDEPTSALDPEMIGEVTNLMRQLAKEGMTMIVVSHEMNFIKDFCTKVCFMTDGRIIEEGTAKQIFENPKDERIKGFLSRVNRK